MSGYIGSQKSSSVPSFSGIDVEVSGIAQKNTTAEAIVIPTGENQLYFGDTTFTGTVNVAGNLVILGGTPDFQDTISITGTLSIG